MQEPSKYYYNNVSGGVRFLERMGLIHLVVDASDRRTFYRPELSLRRLVTGLIKENLTPALERGERLLDEVAKKRGSLRSLEGSSLETSKLE